MSASSGAKIKTLIQWWQSLVCLQSKCHLKFISLTESLLQVCVLSCTGFPSTAAAGYFYITRWQILRRSSKFSDGGEASRAGQPAEWNRFPVTWNEWKHLCETNLCLTGAMTQSEACQRPLSHCCPGGHSHALEGPGLPREVGIRDCHVGFRASSRWEKKKSWSLTVKPWGIIKDSTIPSFCSGLILHKYPKFWQKVLSFHLSAKKNCCSSGYKTQLLFCCSPLVNKTLQFTLLHPSPGSYFWWTHAETGDRSQLPCLMGKTSSFLFLICVH